MSRPNPGHMSNDANRLPFPSDDAEHGIALEYQPGESLSIRKALTIAGSDSGGGAGIQADLKTFTMLGVFGMSAITALTAQNTVEVRQIVEMAPSFVASQIDVVIEDIGADAVKTGMLSNAAIIEAVADRVRAHHLWPLVVDPVMISKSGAPLLRDEAVEALQQQLLPHASVVTPNLHEAARLTGLDVVSISSMKEAARMLLDRGPRSVVVKGGHLEEDPVDLFADANGFVELRGERFVTKDTHGTGCVFAAAVAAHLARGETSIDAVRMAKAFVARAIRNGLRIGRGSGPANPAG